MADMRPTPVGFFGAIRLCWLLLAHPKQFLEIQDQHNQARNNYTDRVECEPSVYIVRRAFFYSLLLVIASGAVGYGTGLALGSGVGCAQSYLIVWLQVSGASLLLWGTLFIRGWEIETYAGVTFTERVNQWIYRFLYCAGTAVLVFSLAWPQCAK
jgi:hypothetical protein